MIARELPRQRPLFQATSERVLSLRIPISAETAFYIAFFAIIFALRFWDLGARALHHDESIHAKFSWDLVRGEYRHDPVFHGPLYYHVQGAVFFLFGASDYTARVSAAMFGVALCALPLLLRKRLGAAGAMAAVAFIGLSPTIVYYSRFFREDIYMAVFTMLSAVAIWRYIDGGRDRWLIVFALAVTGSFATKEATYLSVAILLVFLDVYLSAQLARATLEDRGTNTTGMRALLTVCIAPYAWAIAASWPFIASLRERAAWPDQLPRPGDLLVLLGTLCLPLLVPFTKPLLEAANVANPGQLDFPGVCSGVGAAAGESRAILGGLFLVVVGAAAFVGLQWRPRIWTIAAGSSALVYLTLMTSLWTNFGGICSGPWGSLDYWLSQQNEFRGDQPWFYYHLLMPAYEFLPLVIAAAGVYWAVVRGDAFSRFLVFWIVATWLSLSIAGEKMPWLNTHIALPVALLAAWTVQRAWSAWRPQALDLALIARLAVIATIACGAMLLVAFLPGGATYAAARVLFAVVAVATIAFIAQPWGRGAAGTVAVVATIGALGFFSLRSMVQVAFESGDVPRDMLVYTQSSPEIARIASDIDQLSAANGKGYDMPILVDSRDSMAWPWAWYLRDYRAVNYSSLESTVPDLGQFDVILVNQSDLSQFQDALSASPVAESFAAPEKYPHRWWFDERYKSAMGAPGMGSCYGSSGDCGPFLERLPTGGHLRLGEPNWDTWGRIWDGITGGWVETWLKYIRDHDRSGGGEWERCRSCGSINAYAYFPANFDRETGLITARPLEPPPPGSDDAGRKVFGGLGSLPGQFFSPVDIEADAAGNLYVIDSSSKKLQKFDAEGNFIASVDVRTNEGGNFIDSEPWGIAIAPDGRIVVADTFGWRVRVFSADLQPTSVTFGNPHAGEDPGEFDLFGPRDAIIDDQARMWVTDTGHDRIVVYTMEGAFVMSIGSSGAGEGEFDEPVSIARSAGGRIYVGDMYNSRIVELDANGAFVRAFSVAGWGGQEVTDKPYMTVLSDGRVVASVPSFGVVRIFSADGELLDTIEDADDPISRPYGLAQAGDDKLWIVEGGNARVRQFDIAATE
jgi:predicted membrane-bound mannosyltransferase